MPLRDIDIVLAALCAKHPQVRVEQPAMGRPGAPRDGIWLLRRPGAACEVQLESSGGRPFAVETKRSGSRVVVETIQEAVEEIELRLGLAGPVN